MRPGQKWNTRNLVCDLHCLIEYASSMYNRYPSDVIMTGTPAGVGPVEPGDVLGAEIESIGRFDIRVATCNTQADRRRAPEPAAFAAGEVGNAPCA